jgi:signal transduction histidine kinase
MSRDFDEPPHRAAGTGLRDTGIALVGAAPWGTHFCQFYATKDDLAELLVPYFAAGLAAGELCMWITSPPLGVEDAWRALAAAVPDLEVHRRAGRIEILPHDAWYLAGGRFDQERVLRAWVDRLEAGLARGCTGLRLSGNTFWLERADWRSFVEYEAAIDAVIGRYRMLALCTYCVDRCNASEIADVIRNHQFALMKRDGRWERFESFDRRRIEDVLAAERERLAGALAELREIDRRRNDFLATLSHELRNPLAPLKNAAFVLRRAEPASEQARRARDIIERQADQLTRLVDELLDVTRIARGKMELRCARVDLADVVRGAGEDHAFLFTERGLDLAVVVPDGEIWIDGDPGRIAQLVGNLLQNAIRHTPSGGQVSLAVRAPAAAEIRVRDSGEGISPELLGRVFEPFEQGEERGRAGGLGLGLALVKGIAEALRLELTVESIVGQGTTFHVLVPAEAAAKG